MLKKVVGLIAAGTLTTGILPGAIASAETEYGSVTISPQTYYNAQKYYFEGNGGKFASKGYGQLA